MTPSSFSGFIANPTGCLAIRTLIGNEIMDKYGFSDFNDLGDDIDMILGGYHYDQISTATARGWLRQKGKGLNLENKPWFLTLGLVNPHDVMFYNTDKPGENIQKQPDLAFEIEHDPDDQIYKNKWAYPLSPSRKQPRDDPGRPLAYKEYQKCRKALAGQFPNEDARWKRLQDYYFNCISDCDRSVVRILNELESLEMLDNTIVIFTADHGELCGGTVCTVYTVKDPMPIESRTMFLLSFIIPIFRAAENARQ